MINTFKSDAMVFIYRKKSSYLFLIYNKGGISYIKIHGEKTFLRSILSFNLMPVVHVNCNGPRCWNLLNNVPVMLRFFFLSYLKLICLIYI